MNSLGFDKSEKNTKVVVAMSGGVDSSVAAVMLKKEGYDVIGITLKLYNNSNVTKNKTCCAGIDIQDAKNVAKKNNFSVQDFAKTHPEGTLGKRLLITVSGIMTKKNIPLLKVTDKFINLIKKTTKSNLGLAVVVDNKNNIQGVISDGDIKRIMQKNKKFTDLILKDIMTTDPLFITPDSLAAEALNIMEENNIDALPVIEKRKILGIVTLKEVIKSIN